MLHASSNILTEMAAMAKIGTWELNVSDMEMLWSEEAFRIHRSVKLGKENISQIVKGYPKAAREQLDELIDLAICQAKPFDIELPFHKTGRQQIWIRILGKPMQEQGKTVKVYGAFLDVSARKETELNLIKAKELAEEADKLKTDFLSTMSHEIRTPLNAIVGFTDLLLAGDTLPQQVESLNILKFSASNLMDLINDILDYHKIQSGKIDLELVAVDIRELLEQTLGYFRQQLEYSQVQMNVNVAPNVPKWINGDRTRLAQILTNLVANAVKFTQEGTIEVNVSLEKINHNLTEMKFVVKDTGIGIAKDKLELIFESFTQASRDTTRKYGGTGLGLAISRKLIELQGGKISVESKVGLGTSFCFTIPFDTQELQLKPAAMVEDQSLAGKRALLVEDNEINVKLVVRLLNRWGVVFDVAENGMVALGYIESQRYDFVLMDLHMPVMDGYQATKQIRELPGANRNVPIIALTASAVTVIREDMLAQGFDELVYKPYPPKELFAKIKLLI